jgi:diguanylate cyclase (GGDEF)-like protein
LDREIGVEYEDLVYFLQHVGKDPSRLIFEDELTGIYNRRFLLNYFQHKISWDALEDNPLSLLMMDVDHFKQINDTHGHGVGDKALIRVAGFLKEAAGESGLPIRYAGDEFMILMPSADKQAALQMGEQLLTLVHENPVSLPEVQGEIAITLSIGVASAPDDAQSGETLVQKADTALYSAKKAGRDRLANAGEIALREVFAKTALQQIGAAKIAGRKSQLAQVSAALKKYSRRQSQFLLVEGAAGMGKTEFLATIRRNLAQTKIWQIQASGNPQELFRPYYLTTNILIGLLNQREDKGTKVFESLSPREIAYLSHILPQLGGAEEITGEDEKVQREGIFSTLVHFIPKVLDSCPLILFIDDLHFSDEATLLLLRRLILRQDIPLFVCATSTGSGQSIVEGQPVPLERFCKAFAQELSIQTITLTPLTAEDIRKHLQSMFPQVQLPENFEHVLAEITQGNPLFISGILRKLVLDQKIILVGQEWIVEPLGEGYLPGSLEEIVTQKVASLDEESRRLLDQASAFGENISLSQLTGSSENRETKVLEFVDQAVAQGLVKTDFQMNDETIRFLGKRVQEITYGEIEQERKHKLHERVGAYQETLFDQRLLPSAATLAYHFQRSANQEKARRYLESQQTINNRIFSAQEAMEYTGQKLPDAVPEDVPLHPSSLPQIPTLIRALLTTIRNIKLYPPGSKAIVSSTSELKETIEKILADNERVTITHAEQVLMVNGETVDIGEFKSVTETFMKFLGRLELSGVGFSRGLAEHELTVMLEALGRISKKMIDKRFWQRFAAEQRLLHIDLRQVRYTTVATPDKTADLQETPLRTGIARPGKDLARAVADVHAMDEEDLTKIPHIIRCLLTASSNIKLYPPESKAITRSIEEFKESLDSFLTRRPFLILARVGDALLVNGEKIDTADFKAMADSFVNMLSTIQLSSLTFLRHFSARELKILVAKLGQPLADGMNTAVWQQFASEQKMSAIFFDMHLYEILGERAGADVRPGAPLGEQEAEQPHEPGQVGAAAEGDQLSQIGSAGQAEIFEELPFTQPVALGITEESLAEMPDKITDLLLKGHEKEAAESLSQLFENFQNRAPDQRRQIVRICQTLIQSPTLSSQLQFVKFVADLLLAASSQEDEPEILTEMNTLLHSTATNFVQFADYRFASSIFLNLQKRYQELERTNDEKAQLLARILTRPLDPKTQQLLATDLTSAEPFRQQSAAQLLGSLGRPTIPFLIEIIKQEEDLRVRRIAGDLLKKSGPEAAQLLRRQLGLEASAESRARILEVIDSVTRDLKSELAYALGDQDSRVRQAAFQLAERLNDEQVLELLLDFAQNEELSLAITAIKYLGKFKSTRVVNLLVSLLDSDKEQEKLVACCRSLGQIADPSAIDHLAKILAPPRRLFRRKKHNPLLRATAAFALAEIAHPRAAEVLGPFAEDSDPRVREIARARVSAKRPSSSSRPQDVAAVQPDQDRSRFKT